MSHSASAIVYGMNATPSGQRLTPLDKLVLIYLADNWSTSGHLTYSIEKIAEFALVDYDTADKTIKSLEDNGAIWAIRQKMMQDEIRLADEIRKNKATSYQKRGVPKKIKAIVHSKDNYACVICKNTEDLCVDHILPEVEGGSDDIDNLQTLCRSCNSKKGTRGVVDSERTGVTTFESLRGIGKETFEALGSGETFIRKERENFYGKNTPDPSML